MLTFFQASPELTLAARCQIAKDTARHITSARANIGNASEISDVLSAAGFGAASVERLAIFAAAISSGNYGFSRGIH